MADTPPANTSGGFTPNALPNTTVTATSLPSPAPSSRSSTNGLPHPRAQPLRPGSVKEDDLRRFVQKRLLHINRRYVKKFGIPEPGDLVTGYASAAELCRDLDVVVNMLWLSGTPALQVPYYLNIANELTEWLDSFAPSPAATLATLRKLDHCFASLLAGRDVETGETLPGFTPGSAVGGLSRTDMVRCRSLVEQTRVLMVNVMNRDPEPEERVVDVTPTETEGETDTESEGGSVSDKPAGTWGEDDDDDDDNDLQMEVARVYEKTLVQLGIALGEGPTSG